MSRIALLGKETASIKSWSDCRDETTVIFTLLLPRMNPAIDATHRGHNDKS